MSKQNISSKQSINMPPIMIGTYQINDYTTMYDVIDNAVQSGCKAFDTSPSYNSEINLGKAIKEVSIKYGIDRSDFFISDKIDGWQMYKCNGSVESYVDKSLKDMQLDYFDQILIHWPFDKYLKNTWNSLKDILRDGKAKYIGICNIDKRKLNQFISNGNDINPDVVQIEISPFRTAKEDVEYFKEKNICIQAYSPLCRMITDIKSNVVLNKIALSYNKTVAQIILRWHIEKGAIPVFTSKKGDRIKSNLSVFDFTLSESEILMIDSLDRDYKLFPESYGCPGY